MAQSTEQRLLDILLLERRRRYAGTSEDAFFNIFSAEQALVDRDLSPDQLRDGIVDGANDCGIDGFWIFVDGRYVAGQAEHQISGKNPLIEIEILQAKTSPGFSEMAIEKLLVHLPSLLDSLSDSIPETAINTKLHDRTRRLHRVLDNLASSFPRISIRVAYATRAAEPPHPHVVAKSEMLKKELEQVIRGMSTSFEFLDAPVLRETASRGENFTLDLPFSGNPIMADRGQAYVCLVRLADYFQFLCTANGLLRLELFEANVRDYAGKSIVNEQIELTLASAPEDDFWCFNNGVTIVSAEASIVGRRLVLRNPQVVNGLQTSNEIHEHFSREGLENEDRSLLVRIVVPSAEATRDKIILATNSQTQLPPGALRATEPFQLNLEEWLNRNGYYYERRANSYKNLGIANDQIVGMSQLARRFVAVGLGKPEEALSKGDILLEERSTYALIFSQEYELDAYVAVLNLFDATDNFLKTLQADRQLKGESIEPWSYHYAYAVALFLQRSHLAQPRRLHLLNVESLTSARAKRLFDVLAQTMEKAVTSRMGTGLHEIARSSQFTSRVQVAVRRVIERKSIQ